MNALPEIQVVAELSLPTDVEAIKVDEHPFIAVDRTRDEHDRAGSRIVARQADVRDRGALGQRAAATSPG